MKFALVKGSGFSPWEAPLHEALEKYGMKGIGICSDDNIFSFSGIKMPIIKLKRAGKYVKPRILARAIQYVKPFNEYLIGLDKAVKDVDLLHTTETFNVYSKQCVDTGKPTVVSVCDNIPYNRRKKLDSLDEYVKKRAKHFIVTTELGKRMLLLEGIESNKVSVVPHAIDTNQFKPLKKDKSLLKRFGVPESSKVILFAGELEETKGVQYLIFAFNELLKKDKNLVLLIAGKGSLKEWLIELVKRMGLSKNVRFIGYYSYHEMPVIHNLADLFCLPSAIVPRTFFNEAWNEKFGYVLIEAMACGKPIVSTTSGGIPLVVENGKQGLLVPSGNWVALSDALDKILFNKKLAESLAKNGRARAVREYDTQIVAKKLANAYRQASKY